MSSFRLCCAAVAAGVLLNAGQALAVEIAEPMAPQIVIPPPAQLLAQAPTADPCVRAVRVEQHDKWLSTSRGDTRPLRAGAHVWLTKAGIAASQGDEAACWHHLGIAELMDSP